VAPKSKIVVSHSGKQYVHRLVQGLLTNGYPVTFCTPLWFTTIPAWLKIVPGGIRRIIFAELNKRHFHFVGNISLQTAPFVAFKKKFGEYIGLKTNLDKAQLSLEKDHDHFTATQIRKIDPDIVIGYEISSAETFSIARKKKKITVLDLAQIHFLDVLEIAHRFNEMGHILENPHLSEINARKQKEYELADYIITLSSFARESLMGRVIDPKKIYQVHLGFDVKMFTPKLAYGKEGPLKLMICGTDLKRKGLMLLLKVFAGLVQKEYLLELSIVGPLKETREIMKGYEQLKNIYVFDFLTQEELVKKYQEADVFVFPSYLDSWAMTVLESMACGTPVIITENTGSKDAVNKGGGIIIPVGDPVALKEAILGFYLDRNRIEASGRIAQQVARNFSWENYYQQLGRVVKEIEDQSRA
jgi:glycosyltransferase involved in cell wall biosynthesis